MENKNFCRIVVFLLFWQKIKIPVFSKATEGYVRERFSIDN